MNWPSWSGVIGVGIRPWASSFSRTSGAASARIASLFRRVTISFGVPPGAIIGYQFSASKPGRPVSAINGASGRAS